MNRTQVMMSSLVVVAGIWLWLSEHRTDLGKISQNDETEIEGNAAAKSTLPKELNDDVPSLIELEEKQVEQVMLDHQTFQRDIHDFLKSDGNRNATNTSKDLERMLGKLAAQQLVTPFEELMIRLALSKHTLSEDDFQEESTRLMAEYDRTVKQKQSGTKPNSKHLAYKEKEQEIMYEVLAMDEYPDGLSRDEYLKQRLDQVRSEVYSHAEHMD